MRIFLIAIVVLAAAGAGGALYLATLDMPPPTATMEKTIPNETLGQ
jgi:hypothetical protein